MTSACASLVATIFHMAPKKYNLDRVFVFMFFIILLCSIFFYYCYAINFFLWIFTLVCTFRFSTNLKFDSIFIFLVVFRFNDARMYFKVTTVREWYSKWYLSMVLCHMEVSQYRDDFKHFPVYKTLVIYNCYFDLNSIKKSPVIRQFYDV